jgi:hypothetical protein
VSSKNRQARLLFGCGCLLFLIHDKDIRNLFQAFHNPGISTSFGLTQLIGSLNSSRFEFSNGLDQVCFLFCPILASAGLALAYLSWFRSNFCSFMQFHGGFDLVWSCFWVLQLVFLWFFVACLCFLLDG